MKVLMVNKFLYANGGSETYVFQLGEYLQSIGHQVEYFGMEHPDRCVGNSAGSYTREMDFHKSGTLEKLTYPVKTVYSIDARKKIRKVLDSFKPDVVHLNNFNYQLTPSILIEIDSWRKKTGRTCRIVYTAHDYQLICPNHMMKRMDSGENCEACLSKNYLSCVKGRCIHGSAARSVIGAAEGAYWSGRNIYRLIDAIICPSAFMKKKLNQDKVFRGKTKVLHNFIQETSSEDVAKKDYCLYFGRYSEEKGVRTLLEVCKKNPDIPFVFAGSGPLDEEVSGIANITNMGFLTGENLEKLIREARFSIYPSEWYENCPFSVMESQMYGTPVLGADIGGIPELIQNGSTGELFSSGSETDLENKIRKLWDNPELTEQYSVNCKDIQFDSVEEYTKKLLKIYSSKRTADSNNRKTNRVKNKTANVNRTSGGSGAGKKLNGTVIVTYRCNARCNMCNRYKRPSRPEEEITVETIRKLPKMYFTNITGGEPFIREDLKDIVRELYKKSDRIVISTNGFFTDRIIDLCREFPDIGIRISIEGLEETNNRIRGLDNGFQRGYSTLKKLVAMGMKDVGFGMTVQDSNCKDLVKLYKISDQMNMEFATASLHNSFYFVESKNIIHNRPMVAKQFEKLINELLNSNSPKKWFRAYFNHGLINYIYGQKRLLPCDMSFDTFFIDPYGDVMPCNGTKDKEVMGNLNEQSWEELWNSRQADEVRKKVRSCDRNCWMIGSVSPAMHKYIWVPGLWVVKHKFLRFFKKKKYSMYENKIVRDYRQGKVTKEELDRCSTCDLCTEAKDGLR